MKKPFSYTHTHTHTEEAHLDPNDPRNLELFRLVQSIPCSADEAQYFRCAPLIQQINHPLFLPLFLLSNSPPSFLFCPPSFPSFPSLYLSFPLPPLLPPSSPSSLLSFPCGPLFLRLLDVDNEERFVSDEQFSNDRRFQLLQLRDQGVSHDTTI